MNILQTVSSRLSEILGRRSEDFSAHYALSPSNGVMPIDIAALAIACERAFGIALYDEKVIAWQTVGDAVRHIEKLHEDGQHENTERTDSDREAWFYE